MLHVYSELSLIAFSLCTYVSWLVGGEEKKVVTPLYVFGSWPLTSWWWF
jgi:hypothetical protein